MERLKNWDRSEKNRENDGFFNFGRNVHCSPYTYQNYKYCVPSIFSYFKTKSILVQNFISLIFETLV
jgi:hypothetical protein